MDKLFISVVFLSILQAIGLSLLLLQDSIQDVDIVSIVFLSISIIVNICNTIYIIVRIRME